MPTKKNGYNPPKCSDPRLLWVAVGCGNCIECRTQKSREWQIRLNKELERTKYAYFCTFTFSEESLDELEKACNSNNVNILATIGVRRFLERVRKRTKKSLRHWLITELGHEGTERIHLHGILFSDTELEREQLEKDWRYGYIDLGEYCNERSINYIVKYMVKVDNDHKGYEPKIFCSAGLGANYVNETTRELHKYKPNETIEYLRLKDGTIVTEPIYYRNKFLSEEEREKLWQEKLDEQVIYVRGIKCDISTEQGRKQYEEILNEQQKINLSLGYGDNSENWNRKEYRRTLKHINSINKKTPRTRAQK